MLATFFLGEHNVGQESHLPSDNKSWCLYNLVLNLNKSCAWVRKESGEGISPVQIPPTSSEKPSRSAGSGCPGHAMHPSPETQWLTVEPPTPSYRKVLLRIARRLLFWPWCSGSWTLALFFTVDTCFDQPPLALVTNSEPFPCFFFVLFFFLSWLLTQLCTISSPEAAGERDSSHCLSLPDWPKAPWVSFGRSGQCVASFIQVMGHLQQQYL